MGWWDDAAELEPAAAGAAEELVLGLRGLAEPVDLDKAERGGGVVLVAFFIGRQLIAIEAVHAQARNGVIEKEFFMSRA